MTAIDEIISAHTGRRVVVVCHAGVIGTHLANILGFAKPGGFFHPDYTSMHRVVAWSRGHRTIHTLNELTRLRAHVLAAASSLGQWSRGHFMRTTYPVSTTRRVGALR